MQQTITQAAQLYGKARSTIHRAIEAGRLSCTTRGDGVRLIDLAELIRLWGEPTNRPPQTQQNAIEETEGTQQALIAELKALRAEITSLRDEVKELRRLPAPPEQKPEQDAPRQPPHAPIETPPANDDPHGLRSLARAIFDAPQREK